MQIAAAASANVGTHIATRRVACFETSHGPVVFGDPRAGAAIAMRSTALVQPSNGLGVLAPMLRCRDVHGLRAVMHDWVDPAIAPPSTNDSTPPRAPDEAIVIAAGCCGSAMLNSPSMPPGSSPTYTATSRTRPSG